MTDGIKPASALTALVRMQQMAAMGDAISYKLGTGNYNRDGFAKEYDCAGAICEAYMVTRHRPGFARGRMPPGWERFADVVDDINTNSMIKDAVVRQELFRFVPKGEALEPGDLLAYPTIIIVDADDGERHKWIGHIMLVEDPKGATASGPWRDCRMLHCHGPNGRKPGVERASGKLMDRHNEVWPKAAHRAWVLRVVD